MTAPSASVPLDNDRSLDVHLDDDLVVLGVASAWEERLTREQAWLLMDALDLVATWGPGPSNATPTERPGRPSEPVPLHSEDDIRAARRTSYTGKAITAFVLGFFLWIPASSPPSCSTTRPGAPRQSRTSRYPASAASPSCSGSMSPGSRSSRCLSTPRLRFHKCPADSCQILPRLACVLHRRSHQATSPSRRQRNEASRPTTPKARCRVR